MYDVLVIGCGITGAATAFELSRYQLKVAIVERENDGHHQGQLRHSPCGL